MQAAARAAERRAADEKWCASAGAHSGKDVENVPGAASGSLQVRTLKHLYEAVSAYSNP